MKPSVPKPHPGAAAMWASSMSLSQNVMLPMPKEEMSAKT